MKNKMTEKTELKTDLCCVTYNSGNETKQKVFDRVIQYMKKNSAFSGETIQQCDNCLLEAPNVLSDIVDNILGCEFVDD